MLASKDACQSVLRTCQLYKARFFMDNNLKEEILKHRELLKKNAPSIYLRFALLRKSKQVLPTKATAPDGSGDEPL